MKRGLFLFLVLIYAANTFAQGSLSVFDVDASNFPTMKAKFYAFDNNGNQQSPNPSDITITEDGVPRTVVSVTCPPPSPARPVSIAMSLDISSSMNTSDYGGMPSELGKKTFIELVPRVVNPSTQLAFQTCDDHAMIIQDFTTSRVVMLDALSRIPSGFGNDFAEQLLNPNTGILNIAKKGKYKRFAILYTDAWWNALTQDELQRCKDTCSKYNITFFAVIYTRPEAEPNGIKSSLRDLAQTSGGILYDGITSDQAAKNIAIILQQNIDHGGSPCEVTWESDVSCSVYRNVSFAWDSYLFQKNYHVPNSSIASLSVTPKSLYFRSKPIGLKFDTSITITAINSQFIINNITTTNSDYDINPKSFTLAKGESKVLTVSITPSDSAYSWAMFGIQNDRCEQELFASGGYVGVYPTKDTLTIDFPNGGEQLVAGGDTLIQWSGIPKSDLVNIDFSFNDGTSWTRIFDNVSGNEVRWGIPKINADQCLIRIDQQSQVDLNLNWSRNATTDSSRSYSIGKSIASDAFDNIYVAGEISGLTTFSDGNLYKKSNDSFKRGAGFLSKFHIDGKLEWVHFIGGPDSEPGSASIEKVITDVFGSIFVIGTIRGKIHFEEDTNNYVSDSSDIFIAKYFSNGQLSWVKQIRGKGTDIGKDIVTDATGNIIILATFTKTLDLIDTSVTSYGDKDVLIAKFLGNGGLVWAKHEGGAYGDIAEAIAIDKDGNFVVAGEIYSTVDISGTKLSTGAGQYDNFIAKYDSRGSLVWVKQEGGQYNQWCKDITIDTEGNIYLTGDLSLDRQFSGISLKEEGKIDLYIVKYKPDGSPDWAKSAGGLGAITQVHSINADSLGGVYVTGVMNTEYMDYNSVHSTFGKYSIYNHDKSNPTYIARFLPNGDVSNVHIASIMTHRKSDSAKYCLLSYESESVITSSGSIFITGIYTDTSALGEDTIYTNGCGDMFVRRIEEIPPLQSDTSDAVFSIVMPQYVSTDIDMGKVVVAKAKDSLITAFISNTGTFPFRVDSIWLSGSGAFSLVSGIPPFDVPAGAARQVEFQFRPPSVGMHQATINVKTQADQFQQTIRGEGVLPQVQTLGEVIDFGQVGLSSIKDTIINVAIQNVGTAPVNFTGDVQLGPDVTQYSVLTGGGAFTLQPNESRTVTLRFAPQFIGRSSGRIGFTHDAVGSPAILTLFGWGIGGEVYIPDDSAAPGEHKGIPILLGGKVTKNYSKLGAVKFKADVEFNSSLLVPDGVVLPSVIDKGRRTITIESSWDGSSDTLTTIPFLTALGDAEYTTMNIPKFEWLDGFGALLTLDVETRSGTFKINDICYEGGARLVITGGQFSLSEPIPNPSSSYATIRYDLIEEGQTELIITDVIGRTVRTLFNGDAKPGSYSIRVNTDELATGKYFYTLRTPTLHAMKMLLVEH